MRSAGAHASCAEACEILLGVVSALFTAERYFPPSLKGGSLPGGTLCSAIASIIATIT